MHRSYEDFLWRLNQYRLFKNMTQEDLSKVLGITQSQFSKIELGKVKMPFEALERLMGIGWDVDYLITGKEFTQNVSKLSAMVMQAEIQYRKELLSAVAWLLKQGIVKCCTDLALETKCEMEVLSMRARGGEDHSVLYRIREISGLAQIPMAEKLGVNIKKYRMLEKKKKEPDAELLFRIYEVTGCRPSLLFNHGRVEGMIIDDLWSQISVPIQNEIFSLAEQNLCFIRM